MEILQQPTPRSPFTKISYKSRYTGLNYDALRDDRTGKIKWREYILSNYKEWFNLIYRQEEQILSAFLSRFSNDIPLLSVISAGFVEAKRKLNISSDAPETDDYDEFTVDYDNPPCRRSPFL